MQRWSLILTGYSYKIVHRPGYLHSVADAFSRLPLPDASLEVPIPHETIFVLGHFERTPVTTSEIALKTRCDPILSKVMDFTLNGWPQTVDDDLKPYHIRQNEFLVNQELFYGDLE